MYIHRHDVDFSIQLLLVSYSVQSTFATVINTPHFQSYPLIYHEARIHLEISIILAYGTAMAI